MKKVTGYVLVKETNAGVGGVVVAAYDAKDAPRPGETAPLGAHMGRPLGSVVSDPQGRFELTIEARTTEARPSVVLAVYAPEDSALDDPRPQPADKRLMFLSREAREDAAAQEAFIIRLLQAQLDRHGLGVKPPPAAMGRPALARAGMAAARAEANALRDQFKDQVAEDLAAKLKRREAAKRAVQNLSGIPLHLRDGETRNMFQDNSLLIADRRDLAKRLPDLQERAISQGLARLARRKAKPVTTLYLSSAEIRSLGLNIDEKTGRVSGEVTVEKFRKKAREAIGGHAITRKSGGAMTSLTALRARHLAVQATPRPDTPDIERPQSGRPASPASDGRKKKPTRSKRSKAT